MTDNLSLTSEATKALIIANLAGPNCRRNTEQLLLLYTNIINFNSQGMSGVFTKIGEYFDMSLISFLASYAVIHKKSVFGIDDLVKAYCLDHMAIVQVSGLCFSQKGFAQDYFKELGENGFELNRRNLSRFLFSCIGKIGIVEKNKNDFYQVKITIPTGKVIAKNLYSPFELKKGQKVAVHYAGIFAVIDDETFEEILRKQEKKKDFFKVFKEIKTINYLHWLGNNLAKFTQVEFQKLPKNG